MRYEEYYAKVLLENLFPDRYYNLQIEDKPDLVYYSKKIGIEVTDCTSKNEREIKSLWRKIHTQKGKIRQKSIERMEKLGVSYMKGFITWGTKEYNCSEDFNFENIYCAATKKVKKLNSGIYKELNRYDLFIHSLEFISESLIINIQNKISVINSGERKYAYVYLTTNENELICFDMFNQKYDIKVFDNKQYDYAIEAKKLMEHDNDET